MTVFSYKSQIAVILAVSFMQLSYTYFYSIINKNIAELYQTEFVTSELITYTLVLPTVHKATSEKQTELNHP